MGKPHGNGESQRHHAYSSKCQQWKEKRNAWNWDIQAAGRRTHGCVQGLDVDAVCSLFLFDLSPQSTSPAVGYTALDAVTKQVKDAGRRGGSPTTFPFPQCFVVLERLVQLGGKNIEASSSALDVPRTRRRSPAARVMELARAFCFPSIPGAIPLSHSLPA
ncbi:hypothetical protein BDV28DRAFT_149061 [Aspergillus coremiiformis]|uniref:Uncharacterized protein n=1 Tax=Aspergillus coremiiformis TaxID=138285 RepID=A0A5N6Z406_9EURO|nr:hypothetical protein BDV28DRAFT_149061 [Aspergillus coremiiformis]